MRIRGHLNEGNEDIKLNMTAMIDIVFQLLVFFIMTFKVVAMEGDFDIKMPLASQKTIEDIEKVTTLITVKLSAGADGEITGISADNGSEGESFTTDIFNELTSFVEKTITGEGDPSSAEDVEVEFDIDYGLKYKYTVRAIEAVSGKVQADGSIKTLVEKFKLRDNSGKN
jgi:biopolymer transport protein ExbD